MFKAYFIRVAWVVLSCTLLARTAIAAPADDISSLLKVASEAFAQEKWKEADVAVSKAQRQAKAAGLENDKVMARVFMYQGAVLAARTQKSGEAISVFRQALKISPAAKLPSPLAREEVLDAFKKAVFMERAEQDGEAPSSAVASQASGGTKAAAAQQDTPVNSKTDPHSQPAPAASSQGDNRVGATDEEPDMPADIHRPLYCPNPDEAPPQRKAVLRCVLQPGLAATRVLVFYRLPGSEDYQHVVATKSPRGWYLATVPAKAFQGRLFQFYFEARDATDNSVANNGRYDSPNLMTIREGAPPVTHNALAVRISDGSSVTQSQNAEDEDPLSKLAAGPLTNRDNRFWISLSVGRGFGFHGTSKLEWYGEEISGGTASSGLGLVLPEFGFRLFTNFALALQVRSQIITHTGSDPDRGGGPAIGANAGLLRLIWFVPVGQFSNIQVSGLVGGGEGVRLVVPPNEEQMRNSSDTVRGGPFLVGAGFHADFGFNARWAARLGVEALQGIGDSATAIDFALGGVMRF